MGAGPRIHTDGLIVGFDTGKTLVDNNTFNYSHYLGEPTTNAIPHTANPTLSPSNWTGYGWSGGLVANTEVDALELTATNGWHNRTYNHGITSGTVTVSFEYKLKSLGTNPTTTSHQTYMFILNGTHLGSYVSNLGNISHSDFISGEWKTFTASYTANADSKIAIGVRGKDSAGLSDTVYIKNLQVEAKGHRTPFTTGSRGNTSSLFDITNSTNIDLTNASFSSNAQPDLDGTGDYFQTTTSCGITGDITLEAVFNEEAGTSPHTTIICTDSDHAKGVKLMSYKNSDRYGLWLGFGGTTSYVAMVTGTLSNNTVYHLVGTWEQASGIVKIYLNGSLTGTISTSQTSAVVLNTGKVTVGADYHGLTNSYGVNGQVYVGRVYNKVLEASEVTTNYEAYKNRFNLS
jgi:hypothetical protein